ncbi:MAG TPA: hypothetical protein VNA25_06010 [Phycisphaerae bacterium]|nr:hypothetical protein [Phycisphaerae bacterium]
MTDLAKHIFDLGCTMNRANAEMAGAAHPGEVEDMLDAARRNDPMWCPPMIVESLLRYWHRRIPTGGFLRAVLENDLMVACERADDMNIRHLPGIVRFIYNQLPIGAYGSPKKILAWLAREDEP